MAQPSPTPPDAADLTTPGLYLSRELAALEFNFRVLAMARETTVPLLIDAKGKIVSDNVFPNIALHHFGSVSAVFFIIGLISAAYPSADGALTALTSVFCLDFLGLKSNASMTEEQKTKIRQWVHIAFAGLLFLVIVVFTLWPLLIAAWKVRGRRLNAVLLALLTLRNVVLAVFTLLLST